MRNLCLLAALLGSTFACDSDVINTSGADRPAQVKSQAADAGADAAAKTPKIDFAEAVFVESERSRDPFRSYEVSPAEAKGRYRSQREVVLDKYAVDELKLVGIVTRINPPKAMLVDPSGRGHVVQRGQLVGRAEIVQGSQGGASYEMNWRIDRIREGDVVLIREDPANPDVPSTTKVIPLRPEGSVIAFD
jgi:type IV pilus assembly protein PilP